MSDEPFYSPGHQPSPPHQPKPGEHVWALLRAGRRIDCELQFHGESYGWECQCLYDGDLVYGRRFVLRAQALGGKNSLRLITTEFDFVAADYCSGLAEGV